MRWLIWQKSSAAAGETPLPVPQTSTPWEELYRAHTGQLAEGATLEFSLKYRQISRKTPRHNH
jgi:hypothetical protein